jgi:hypothetical protein
MRRAGGIRAGLGRAAAAMPLALLLASGLPFAAGAADASGAQAKRTYTIPRVNGPAVADGVLDEPFWRQALVLPIAYEIEPGDNVPAPVETEALLAYDEQNLYVGFRAHDPDPGQVRAHLTDRDQAYRDDYVGIVMDTFDDERRGYEFFCNPLGAQMDLARNDLATDEQEDATWDGIWDSGGRITRDGYAVEMVIPFAALRFPRTGGEQTWGVNVFRNYPRSVRHQLASASFDRNRDCMLCQLDKVTGFVGITPGRSLEFDPTVTTHRTDARAGDPPAGPMVRGDARADVGASGRWGLTPNLSLNGAGNPDFSQVEADAPQLSVNTRFALFYPEKRPFFLEGSDLFASPLQAVYTRTVADPSWGLKLSGKEGANAIGAFVTQDERTNLLFPSNQSSEIASLDHPVTSGVLRYRRDISSGSTLGLLVTDREGTGYENRVYGVDGHVRLAKSDVLNLQLLGTSTRYPGALASDNGLPGRRFEGFGGNVLVSHDARAWTGWLSGEMLEPGFRADAGFIPRVDVRTAEVGLERHIRGGEKDWFTRIDLGFEGSRTQDYAGTLTDQAMEFSAAYHGPMQSEVESQLFVNKEYFGGRTYDQTSARLHLDGQPSGSLQIWFTMRGGDAIDYENSRLARLFNGGPGFDYSVGRHLRLTMDHTYERLDVEGRKLYEVNLIASRLVYQFGIRTFARVILNYTDLRSNAGLYTFEVTPRTRELFTQLLFSYKINPQTVLYLGYSGNHSGPSAPDMRPIDRTVFMKIGYAWLL